MSATVSAVPAPLADPAGAAPGAVARAAAVAGLAIGALLAVGPLELRETLPAGPVNLTTTELVAALASFVALIAALWAAARHPAERQRLRQRPLLATAAVLLLWAGVHAASFAWADADRAQVVKAALRVAGQVSLALLCLWWAPQSQFRQRVFAGALSGLGVITLLAVGERVLGQKFEPVLLQFRDEPTWMLGEQRLSTVFYHANTCAGYLEWLAPLVLVLWLRPGQKTWARVVLGLWAALLAVLLSLTYSRAGLVAGVAGALALAWGGRQLAHRRWWLAATLGWAALIGLAYAANPEMRARIGLDERSYLPQYRFVDGCTGHPGDRVSVRLEVRNRGTWALSNRQAPAKVMHSFFTERGKPVDEVWTGERLPPMGKGAVAVVPLQLQLPERPGKYALCADIMRDRVLFLSEVGAPLGWLGCEVVPAGQALGTAGPEPFRPDDLSSMAQRRRIDLQRRHYWRAALLLWERKPWLGWGSDRFRLIHREYVAFEAYDPRARAHSVWLETAVDLGLLGVAALALLVWTLLRAGRLAFRRGWTSDRGTALAIAAGLAAFAVHSGVDYFLAYTQFAVVFWPLVGLLLGLTLAAPSAAQVNLRDSAENAAASCPPGAVP